MSIDSVHDAARARVGPDAGYAGEVDPLEAWELIRNAPDAVLVDVRTQPEWAFVGVPDLSAAGKQAVFVSWQMFPAMNENPNFAAELATRGVAPDATVIFMCRSGQRSAAAARAMTAKGFGRCYNMAEGFEGPLDENKHRGTRGGWKSRGLPWVQG
jgi:rhodanese-related sulfurtransferase